jgi:hypothetical protein
VPPIDRDAAVGQPRRAGDVVDRRIAGEQVGVFPLPQPRYQLVLLLHRRAPIDDAAGRRDAVEAGGRARLVQCLSGTDQRLRRHAADVDAGAADGAVADERDARAVLGAGDRRGEAGRAGADHRQVIAARMTAGHHFPGR